MQISNWSSPNKIKNVISQPEKKMINHSATKNIYFLICILQTANVHAGYTNVSITGNSENTTTFELLKINNTEKVLVEA